MHQARSDLPIAMEMNSMPDRTINRSQVLETIKFVTQKPL